MIDFLIGLGEAFLASAYIVFHICQHRGELGTWVATRKLLLGILISWALLALYVSGFCRMLASG